jgi:FkbM family methyltransferase
MKQNLKDYGWNWDGFAGSARGLAFNRRDLESLDTVMRLVPGRTAAVQAGGCLGIFPKRLAQEFRAVYTFEPDPALFAQLQANVPEPHVVRLQAALGAGPGLVRTSGVRRDGKGNPPHEGLTHVAGPGIVPTLRVDDLDLPACDLIYLDIEGCEARALEGAADTIRRCRPVIALEVHELNVPWSGVPTAYLRAMVESHGYRRAAVVLSDEVFVPQEAA